MLKVGLGAVAMWIGRPQGDRILGQWEWWGKHMTILVGLELTRFKSKKFTWEGIPENVGPVK